MTEAKRDNCSGEGGKAEASMFWAEEELIDSDIDGGATRAFPGNPRFEVTIAGRIVGRGCREKCCGFDQYQQYSVCVEEEGTAIWAA